MPKPELNIAALVEEKKDGTFTTAVTTEKPVNAEFG